MVIQIGNLMDGFLDIRKTFDRSTSTRVVRPFFKLAFVIGREVQAEVNFLSK